jgi:hypothetical protein
LFDWLNKGWNLRQVAETVAISGEHTLKHQITCDGITGILKGIFPKKGIDNSR